MTKEYQPNLKNIGLHKAYDAFVLSLRARNLQRGSVDYYREKLPFFIAFLKEKGVTHIDEIEAGHIREYFVSLEEQGNSPGGRHAYARAIRAWLNFLVEEELIPVSPMARVKMPKVSAEPLPAFSEYEVKRLLNYCNHPRDTALILFMVDTGVRASELLALNVGDVDMITGEVRIIRGKGGKGRLVYAGIATRKAVRRYLRTREYVTDTSPLWTTKKGDDTRLLYAGLRSFLVRLGEEARVEHCSPHTFRRTFALWSLRAGMDVHVLQRLMGHSDPTVLRRYLPLVQDDLQTAHRRHGPVDAHLS